MLLGVVIFGGWIVGVGVAMSDEEHPVWALVYCLASVALTVGWLLVVESKWFMRWDSRRRQEREVREWRERASR